MAAAAAAATSAAAMSSRRGDDSRWRQQACGMAERAEGGMAAVAQERGASCSMRAQAEPTSSQEVEVTAAALEPGVAMGCVQSMHCPGVAGGGRWRCASAWGRRGRVEGVESRQPERDTTDCTRTSNASRGASHSRHGYCEHRLAALVRQGGRPRCRSGERVGLLRGVSGRKCTKV